MRPISGREHDVVLLIAEGLSNKEIARKLDIGVSTTKVHVHNILLKLGLQRRGQIPCWWVSNGEKAP